MKPTRRARVSVVIPCYNYGRFLPAAVESALTQTDVDVDVLIVDDASTDGSADVALALARKHQQVRVLVHSSNQGHIATYNEGLSHVQGDYALLLSADDLLASGALGRAAALMDHHPGVGLVYGFSPAFAEQPPPYRAGVERWTVWTGEEWLASVCRRAKNPVLTPSAVMRTTALHSIGGYDLRLKHSADMLMWMRAALDWDVAYIGGRVQAFYREHGANMHVTDFGGWLRDLELRRELFDVFFSEHCPESTHPRINPRAVRDALARDARRAARALSVTEMPRADLQALLDFADHTVPDPTESGSLTKTGPSWADGLIRSWSSVRDPLAWRYWRGCGVYP